MRISDWSSDVCSSDLPHAIKSLGSRFRGNDGKSGTGGALLMRTPSIPPDPEPLQPPVQRLPRQPQLGRRLRKHAVVALHCVLDCRAVRLVRSEEHKSELQSLMRPTYAVFRLTKKTQ